MSIVRLVSIGGIDDVKDPCNECLGEPANLHSHKPVYYEEDEKKANGGKK